MSTNALFLLRNYVETGVVTASSENASAPGSNVQTSQRSASWRSGVGDSSYLDFALPIARLVTHVAVVDCNLTLNGEIHVEAWDDDIEGAVQTVDITVAPTLYVDPDEPGIPFGEGAFGAGPFGAADTYASINARNVTLIPIPGTVTSMFWRITFTDIDTTYQQCGIVYIARARQYEYNLSYDWRARRIENSISIFSLGKQRYTNPRESQLQLTGRFGFLSEAERTQTLIDMQRFGETKPMIFSIYPETTDRGLTTTVFGCMSASETAHNNVASSSIDFTVTEEL